jgi:hypothetical protein
MTTPLTDRQTSKPKNYAYFRPRRMASWWAKLEDIQCPQREIVGKIERRAAGFAEAGIDTAIMFGFHLRFDFSNYFGSLHRYLAMVSEELHSHGIKFMDHYSCNVIARPRGEEELRKMHRAQRHHVLLHPDPIAAAHAQYAGHRFHDLCEVDIRDGSRGYSWAYQGELFCHNNPAFLDMHRRYLERLRAEVPVDGIEVDDMCDYGGLVTCACQHCRDRFLADYGRVLPPVDDRDFWGDTSAPTAQWGNYENPAFREWIKMRSDSVADHVRMIKATIGDIPLMTCCSNTGPRALNTIGLNLEKISTHLDLLMLENCGLSIETIDWVRMDAEGLQQMEIADKMGRAPAIALSYTIYDDGGYLGWCLARFWGVSNWSSTLLQRLEEDPTDARECHEIVGPYNNWERRHNDLDCREARDLPEVCLVNNHYCRDNGWLDDTGQEHWDRVRKWSRVLVERNIGYRFLLAPELGDPEALAKTSCPLILDGMGCVSDRQFSAIKSHLAQGGKVVFKLPFGSHDENGNRRLRPLSDELLKNQYDGLIDIDDAQPTDALDALVTQGKLTPRVRQVSGDGMWALRIKSYQGHVALHLLNRALAAVPHPTYHDAHTKQAILQAIKATNTQHTAEYLINFAELGTPWQTAELLSPETGAEKRSIEVEMAGPTSIRIRVNLEKIRLYALIQGCSS